MLNLAHISCAAGCFWRFGCLIHRRPFFSQLPFFAPTPERRAALPVFLSSQLLFAVPDILPRPSQGWPCLSDTTPFVVCAGEKARLGACAPRHGVPAQRLPALPGYSAFLAQAPTAGPAPTCPGPFLERAILDSPSPFLAKLNISPCHAFLPVPLCPSQRTTARPSRPRRLNTSAYPSRFQDSLFPYVHASPCLSPPASFPPQCVPPPLWTLYLHATYLPCFFACGTLPSCCQVVCNNSAPRMPCQPAAPSHFPVPEFHPGQQHLRVAHWAAHLPSHPHQAPHLLLSAGSRQQPAGGA